MIALMKRILSVSGSYKGRIQGSFVFSFLKSSLAKASLGLSFFALSAFYHGTATAELCLWLGVAMVGCVLLEILFHHIADRMQSAAGYMVFAEKRMALGAHLRKMPMGYFTEGNIRKISSVLSTDMVFIEENCMTVLADLMSYVFAEAIMVVFMLAFNLWLGLLAVAVIGIALLIGRGLRKEALSDSSVRQEQSESLTEGVLDFTEGIGIIKTYNRLGEKSRELCDSLRESCRKNLQFEENHSPWQLRLNLVFGLGASAVIALSMFLYSRALLDVTYLIGIMLFVFDLFAPLKALYSQSARLTVMNSCMDRTETLLRRRKAADIHCPLHLKGRAHRHPRRGHRQRGCGQ